MNCILCGALCHHALCDTCGQLIARAPHRMPYRPITTLHIPGGLL